MFELGRYAAWLKIMNKFSFEKSSICLYWLILAKDFLNHSKFGQSIASCKNRTLVHTHTRTHITYTAQAKVHQFRHSGNVQYMHEAVNYNIPHLLFQPQNPSY